MSQLSFWTAQFTFHLFRKISITSRLLFWYSGNISSKFDISFSKLSLFLILDHVLPEIIQIEHTKGKKKMGHF